jgi:hypothetical protein
MDRNHFFGIIEFSSAKDRIFWVLGAMGVGFGGILRALNKKKKAQCVSTVGINSVI